ncbi:MAG TPA: hypothetical protein EYO39_06325 [Nitrospirales bacterium]|nr:hypothetical protein [Nitrospirales bacterium]
MTSTALARAYRSVGIRQNIRFAQLCLTFDIHVIDRAVNGVANIFASLSKTLRVLQTGQLQHYAMVIVLGAFVILSGYLFF